MEEIKPLNNDTNNEIPQEQNLQSQQSPTKIIIETEFTDFKKPEEPKLSQQNQNQIQDSTQIDPQLPQPLKQDIAQLSEQKEQNEQNEINNNNQITINNNINASNTNLSLVTNTDPGYIASQSNNEISSTAPPSKSKILGKKIHREYICEVETCKRIFSDKSSLRKHLLTHGEKLFVCEICKKKLTVNIYVKWKHVVEYFQTNHLCVSIY